MAVGPSGLKVVEGQLWQWDHQGWRWWKDSCGSGTLRAEGGGRTAVAVGPSGLEVVEGQLWQWDRQGWRWWKDRQLWRQPSVVLVLMQGSQSGTEASDMQLELKTCRSAVTRAALSLMLENCWPVTVSVHLDVCHCVCCHGTPQTIL